MTLGFGLVHKAAIKIALSDLYIRSVIAIYILGVQHLRVNGGPSANAEDTVLYHINRTVPCIAQNAPELRGTRLADECS